MASCHDHVVESVGYGVYRQTGNWAGKTIAEIRDELQLPWGLPVDAVAYCGTQLLPDQSPMPVGGFIEFHRRSSLSQPAQPDPVKLLVCDLCADSLLGAAYVTDDHVKGWRRYCLPCWDAATGEPPEPDRAGAIAELVEVLAAGAATVESSNGNDSDLDRQSGS